MGVRRDNSYNQLRLEERRAIAELHHAGRSNGQIPAALDRSTSTIGRELKRNGAGPSTGYRPAVARDKTPATTSAPAGSSPVTRTAAMASKSRPASIGLPTNASIPTAA